jgi:hypothetical protein
VAGSCVRGNEPSGSINYWEFHDQLNDYQHYNRNCSPQITQRMLTIIENLRRLRWSSGSHAGLWFPSSRVGFFCV